MENCFLNPLPPCLILKHLPILICNYQFVVHDGNVVMAQPTALAVGQNTEFGFKSNDLVEGRYQKMPATHRRVHHAQAVHHNVCLRQTHPVELIVEGRNIGALPAQLLVETSQHSPPNQVAHHVHCHEAGRKKRAVAVAVQFLKN